MDKKIYMGDYEDCVVKYGELKNAVRELIKAHDEISKSTSSEHYDVLIRKRDDAFKCVKLLMEKK